MEMLPASRLESCARNSVGRRSFDRRSFSIDVAVVGGSRLVHDRGVDSQIALATAGRDDHVHAAAKLFVVLRSRIVERKTGSIGADLLPGFHLAHVTA